MDLSNPVLLFSGLVISTIGLALFIHGKKMERLRNLLIGLAMMIYPIFIPSVLWLWVVAAACVAGVFLLPDGTGQG